MVDRHIILILDGAELNDVILLGPPYEDHYVEFLECNLDGYREVIAVYKKELDEDATQEEKEDHVYRHNGALSRAWLTGLNIIWKHDKVLIRARVIQVAKDTVPSMVDQMFQKIAGLPFIKACGPKAEVRLTITGSQ